MLPLKKDKEGNLLPIKEQKARTPPVDDLVFFFKHCFAEGEEKYRILLLTQLGFGCRIAEICALNIKDLVKDSNFRKWKMLIQKKRENHIVTSELPESIAAVLRNWIIDNKDYILANNGYVFPHRSNNRSYNVKPHHVQGWFCKKRKILAEMYPSRSFGEVEHYRHYKTVSGKYGKTEKIEPVYMWRTHLFRRISGTFLYLLTKDHILVKKFLNHEKLDTTVRHYIDGANDLMENTQRVMINRLFDKEFFDSIAREEQDKNICAVWQEVREL